jgi:lysozyme family protein
MSKDIAALIADVIAREGGYVDNPADRGGPTKFGITEQRARASGYSGDMRNFPVEKARDIYQALYWTRPGFFRIAPRMPKLAAELADMGINMGPKAAAKALQRVLNVLNRKASDYPDIPVDGDIGDLTMFALIGLDKKRPDAEAVLLTGVDCLRGARYIEIAETDPSQEVFEYGWLKRVGAGAEG